MGLFNRGFERGAVRGWLRTRGVEQQVSEQAAFAGRVRFGLVAESNAAIFEVQSSAGFQQAVEGAVGAAEQ